MNSNLVGNSGILFIYNEMENTVNYNDPAIEARCKINTRRLRKSIARFIKQARLIQKKHQDSDSDMRVRFEEKIKNGKCNGNPLHVLLKETGGTAGGKVIVGILMNKAE